MTTVVWFRNDLRVHDNPALAQACRAEGPVQGVFLVSRAQWRRHDMAPVRERFLFECVMALREALHARHIPLHIVEADRFHDAPRALADLLQGLGGTHLHYNEEYEWNERRRDEAVGETLRAMGVGITAHRDQCLLTPGRVLTGQGAFFRVYTPFRRACYKALADRLDTPLKAPRARPTLPDVTERRAAWEPPVIPANRLWPGSEDEAAARLKQFLSEHVRQYKELRDQPAVTGTSALSPYLAVGAISPRQCAHAAWMAGKGSLEPAQAGIAGWINELFWREFYRHLIVGFPDLCKHRPFQTETAAIPWRGEGPLFDAWCQAKTGYPIVDAAMRQLLATGWMHNRLRMITAMFLTKHLFTDWRLGERFFMQHLVDGDFASNNGGWQWSASTGADAAPYFRVFNPRLQSERFDPQGRFLRHWLPELKDVSDREIHAPSPLVAQSVGYPMPVVDHRQATDDVKRQFSQLAAMRESHGEA